MELNGAQPVLLTLFAASSLLLSLGERARAAAPAQPFGRCAGEAESIVSSFARAPQWANAIPLQAGTLHLTSPSDHVGTWLDAEKWPDGSFRVSAVNARTTETYSFQAETCTPSRQTFARSYDQALAAQKYTDQTLETRILSRKTGIIYAWSPAMPLSVRGIPTITAAAKTLGLSLTLVLDPRADLTQAKAMAHSLHLGDTDFSKIESIEMFYRGMTSHFPSVLVYRDGKVLGDIFVGYKDKWQWIELLKNRLEAPSQELAAHPLAATPRLVNHTIELLRTTPTLRPAGYYFKPSPGTEWVAFASMGTNYFYNLDTKKEQVVPGQFDPVPTPDDRFLTIPPGKLTFYRISDLLKTPPDTTPALQDDTMDDQYQSIALLADSPTQTDLRVLMAWTKGIKVRDYRVTSGANGGPAKIAPLSAHVDLCDSSLSVPMIAKNGKEIGGMISDGSGMKIYAIDPEKTTCKESLAIGYRTSKIAFSFTPNEIGFSAPKVNAYMSGKLADVSAMAFSDAYVLRRDKMELIQLTQNSDGISTYPEFLKDGRIVYLDVKNGGGTVFKTVRIKD